MNGRYDIVRELGRGAMGEVYLGVDRERDGTRVAMKYLLLPERQSTTDRFKAEFTTLAHLQHPNIPLVYDLATDDANGKHFFTTEYIVGTAFDVAAQELPLETTMALAVQALRALEYLHQRDLLHLDIKSHNVMVASQAGAVPVVKLIDFGLAGIGWKGRRTGTPSYMAPEIVREQTADARSDLYSFGVLLYLALTHWNPFRLPDVQRTMEQHCRLIPPPPSSCRPAIPTWLDRIVLCLLEKTPEDRFASAAAAIDAISRCQRGEYSVETAETLGSYVPTAGPFVGRSPELKRLRQLLMPVSAEHTPAPPVCWIHGALGTGRTRLLQEAKQMAQMADYRTELLALAELHDPEAFAQRLRTVLDEGGHRHWIGIDDADLLVTDHRWHTLTEPLCEIVQQLGLQQQLLMENERHPCVVVFTSSNEPALMQQLANLLLLSMPQVMPLALRNFSQEELVAYLQTTTGLANPPQSLVQQVSAYTAGHPLFVTETLRALIRKGLLFDQHGRWTAETYADLGIDFARLEVPPTVEAIVAQGYARQPAAAQEVLGIMATHDAPITQDLMETLLEKTIPATILSTLVEQRLLQFHPPDGCYRFRTRAQAQAIYRQLGRAQQQQWHDRIARILAAQPTADLEQLYHHKAHGSHPREAQEACWELSRHLLEVHRPAEAIPYVQRYIDQLPPADDARRAEAYYCLGQGYYAMREFGRAIEIYRTGIAQCRDAQTAQSWHLTFREAWGLAAMRARRYAEAAQQFRQVLVMLGDGDTHRAQRLRVENSIATTIMYQDPSPTALEEAVAIFRRTHAAAMALPFGERETILNNDLGYALFMQKRYAEAKTILEHHCECFEQAGAARRLTRALSLLAETHRGLKDHAAAAACCERALPIAQQTRDPERLMLLYNSLGNIHAEQGDDAQAIHFYERALDLCGRVSDQGRAMALTLNLGELYWKEKKLRRAEAYLQSTIAFAESGKVAGGIDRQFECQAHLTLAELFHHQQHYGEVHHHLDLAQATAEHHASCHPLLFYIVLERIQAHRDQGETAQAERLTSTLDRLAETPALRTMADAIEHALHSRGEGTMSVKTEPS